MTTVSSHARFERDRFENVVEPMEIWLLRFLGCASVVEYNSRLAHHVIVSPPTRVTPARFRPRVRVGHHGIFGSPQRRSLRQRC